MGGLFRGDTIRYCSWERCAETWYSYKWQGRRQGRMPCSQFDNEYSPKIAQLNHVGWRQNSPIRRSLRIVSTCCYTEQAVSTCSTRKWWETSVSWRYYKSRRDWERERTCLYLINWEWRKLHVEGGGISGREYWAIARDCGMDWKETWVDVLNGQRVCALTFQLTWYAWLRQTRVKLTKEQPSWLWVVQTNML